MLVLRRKIGEQITINDTTIVTVLAVEGERIKLGIQAPSDVSIVRTELLTRDDRPASEMHGA